MGKFKRSAKKRAAALRAAEGNVPVQVRAKVGAITFTGNVHQGEDGSEYFTYVTSKGDAKVARKFTRV